MTNKEEVAGLIKNGDLFKHEEKDKVIDMLNSNDPEMNDLGWTLVANKLISKYDKRKQKEEEADS